MGSMFWSYTCTYVYIYIYIYVYIYIYTNNTNIIYNTVYDSSHAFGLEELRCFTREASKGRCVFVLSHVFCLLEARFEALKFKPSTTPTHPSPPVPQSKCL